MHTYTEEDIARYVNGDLTDGALQQFEQTLQRDKTLQQSVLQYREVLSTLRPVLAPDQQDLALKATMQSLNKVYFDQQAVPERPVRVYVWWSSVAAAVAIVLIVTLLHPWRKGNLYEEYASVEMVTSAERGTQTDALLQKAALAFNDDQFAAAQKYLETAYAKDTDNPLIQFYYAVTLVESNQFSTARPLLDEVYKGSSVFKYEAAFYMALSYLKEDDKVNCLTWLQKIPQGTSLYAQAQSLQHQL